MRDMRIQRFYCKQKRTARISAPWAAKLIRVDGIWIAYESAQEAEENHGPLPKACECAGVVVPPRMARVGRSDGKKAPRVLPRGREDFAEWVRIREFYGRFN